MNVRVAIHQRTGEIVHSGSWSLPWIALCQNEGIDHEVIDCFQGDVIGRLRNFDVLLFHFDHYVYSDMLHARSILYAAREMGLKIFPDFPDAWHFDDKVAQSYLLEAIAAPIPKFQVFHSLADFKKWLGTSPDFPVVAKLSCGSGSHNVKLLENLRQADSYGRRMFGKGFKTAPSLLFKATSNVRSSRSSDDFWRRFRRIPEFLRTLNNARNFPREKGYVYLQEFVQNNGYDIKVAVVNDKVSYLVRQVRNGDFRASGGGDINYNRSAVPENVIQSARAVARKLNLRCMGFDYVVDAKTGRGLIVEMSYGFSWRAILDAGGYWDENLTWIESPLDVPKEILMSVAQK